MICLHVVDDRRDWVCPGLQCPCICMACVQYHLDIWEDYRRINRAPDIRRARARRLR